MTKIKVEEFNGFAGYKVDKDNGDGVLGAEDEVSKGGTPVAFDDPKFVAARDDFQRLSTDLDDTAKLIDKAQDDSSAIKNLDGLFNRRMSQAAGGVSPRIRSKALMQASAAKGLIAKNVHFWNAKEPGEAALTELIRAMDADPGYSVPRFAYAITLLNLTCGHWQGKKEDFFQDVAHKSLKDGFRLAAADLERFPNDVMVQVALKAVYERIIDKDWGDATTLTALNKTNMRIGQLKKSQSKDARQAEQMINNI